MHKKHTPKITRTYPGVKSKSSRKPDFLLTRHLANVTIYQLTGNLHFWPIELQLWPGSWQKNTFDQVPGKWHFWAGTWHLRSTTVPRWSVVVSSESGFLLSSTSAINSTPLMNGVNSAMSISKINVNKSSLTLACGLIWPGNGTFSHPPALGVQLSKGYVFSNFHFSVSLSFPFLFKQPSSSSSPYWSVHQSPGNSMCPSPLSSIHFPCFHFPSLFLFSLFLWFSLSIFFVFTFPF